MRGSLLIVGSTTIFFIEGIMVLMKCSVFIIIKFYYIFIVNFYTKCTYFVIGILSFTCHCLFVTMDTINCFFIRPIEFNDKKMLISSSKFRRISGFRNYLYNNYFKLLLSTW